MRTIKAIPLPVAALLLTALLIVPAEAQTGCEVPLFVQQGTIDANVVILFDNSGSMCEAVYHPDFDNSITWSGNFTATQLYQVGTSGLKTPRSFNSYWPSTPSAPLVKSYNQNGRYYGNYLNWIFFHATAAQRAALPQLTLIDVAHDVVSEIIERTERVRFGVAVFKSGTSDPLGGTILAECGAAKAALVSTVRSIEGTAWTPLAETMETIVNYYKRTSSSAPIQAHCQQNFVVVVTDGLPTMDVDVSPYLVASNPDPGDCASIGAPQYPSTNKCSRFFPEVAHWLYANDLRADLPGMQNVITYTIGFNIDAPLLAESAERGGGLYMSAMNAVELWSSLELVMLDIINRISAGSAVAVVSTERGDGDRLYRGKFMPGSWHGYIESFALPYTGGDQPLWEAGYLLMQRAASTREINAGLGGSLVPFQTTSADVLMAPMGLASTAAAAEVINWTRGENVSGLRDRNNWKLGDIIHSTPVVVGAPANFTLDESYQNFMDAQAMRTKMVYAGANDGMLHALYAETGQEAWAFIPEFALPKLADIADTAYCHTYTVDLTPAVHDCQIDGVWSTVLVGGGRQGGAGFFGLDITSPESPQLLWQVALPDGNAFASEVEFVVINSEPVVLIGSGLDTANGRARLYAYAVSDGAYLGSVLLSSDSTRRNKATAATAVDLNHDGNHDFCYIADLQGHVWKIDFRNSLNPALWQRYCLWQGAEEITARPSAAYGPGNSVYVYFGTGAYLVESDLTTTDDQIFGCIFDRQNGVEYATLINQTNEINDLTGRDGWYIELLRAAGERVTEPAAIVAGAVFFTSFAPSQDVCDAGGRSWLYRIDYRNGGALENCEGDAWDGEIYLDLGQGVASRPVIDIVNETVIVQSSDATILVQDIGQTIFRLTVRAWQENFDYVVMPPNE